MPGGVAVIAILLVALTVDLWVYNDAGKRQQHGLGPSVSIGSVRVETPEAWFLGCVLLWVVFVPLS